MKTHLHYLRQNNLFDNSHSAVIFRKAISILFFVLILSGQKTWGQLPLTNAGNTATLDFSNSMPSTVGSNPGTAYTGAGFSPDPITAGRLNSNAWAATGWSDGSLTFGSSITTGDYARGAVNTAQTTGGFYANTNPPGSASNPAFMIQPGGSDWAPGTLTLRIKNNGTTNITQLAVSYNIYVRNDQGRSNSFNFSYSTDDVTYTPVGALDYTSTIALDALGWVIVGSAPSRSTTIPSLSIAPNSLIYIRWSGADVGGSGSRDEFGLDDISLNATFTAPAGTFTPGALSAFGNVCVNTVAGPNSFSLSGSSLDGTTVTIGPLTGFTFDNGGGYGATATITGYGTSFSTNINVKFNPVAAQAYGGTGVNGIPISGGNGASVYVDASGTGIAVPSITSASASPNPSCSGSNVVLLSAPTAVANSGAVGTSTGSSAAGNTPYRSAITTEARVQYIFTAAELSGIGMVANSNITSLAFNVTSAGSGTMTNYTISIAATATTSFPSTSYLTGTFTTIYGPQNVTAVAGLNTHIFSTPFTWNGSSGIVINICYNSSGGTSAVVSVNSPGGSPTDSRSGSSSCTTSTGTLDAGRPIVTFGYSTNPNPNIYNWSWSPGGPTSNNPTVNPTSNQLYTVTATTPGSACTASSNVNVVVNATTIPGSVTGGTTPICLGNGTGTMNLGTHTGTVDKWQRQLNGGGYTDISSTAGLTSYSEIPASAGTWDYRAVVHNGACGALNSAANTITVNTLSIAPTGATGTTTICNGGSTTLTVGGGSAGTGATAEWFTGSCGGTSAGTGNSILASPSSTETYYVRYNGTCNTTLCASVTVTVNTSSIAPTSVTSDDPNSEICSGQNVLLTANGGAFGDAPGASYKWYESGCGTGSVLGSASTLNVINPTTGSHTYYARIEDACGNTSCASITILVTGAPPVNTVGTVNGPSAACSGTVSLVTVNTVGGPNINYSWNTGSNSSTVLWSNNFGGPFLPGPFLTATNQVYAQFGALGAGQSGYNICVQGINACGSTNNKCLFIRGTVGVPGAIAPADPVACPNDVKSYSCGASGGATVYNWTLGGSATPVTSGQGTQNVQVTFPVAFVSGQLCVTASLSCGGSSTSAPRCMTIYNTPAIPQPITGPSKVCPGATGVAFSVPLVSGATGYSWAVPAGATIATGTNTNAITVNFPAVYPGANVCVSATSACGTSAQRCKAVGTNIPAQPGLISGPATNVCNSTAQYSIANVSGANGYTWANPAGTTITNGQGSTTILLSVGSAFTSGVLSVTATTNLCTPGSSPARTLTINGKPNTPGTITANPVLWCSGGFVNFSVTPVAPLPTYNWTVSNGTITAGQGSDNIDVTWGTGTGGVNVTASNTCGTSAFRSQSFSSGCREEELSASGSFAVYPNPAHDYVMVSIYLKEITGFVMNLRDVSGRTLLSQNATGTEGLNTFDLDLSHLSKGVYILDVKSVSNNWIKKVDVE